MFDWSRESVGGAGLCNALHNSKAVVWRSDKKSSIMIGKTDFPEVLPSPPSPSSVKALLGPADFSSSEEDFEKYDTSNFSIDTNNFNNFSNNFTKISGQFTASSVGRLLYSPSSSSSSVSVTHSELHGAGEYLLCSQKTVKKDDQNLYPVVEIMDGKEVVTITTSNTVSTRSSLSTSKQGSKSNSSVVTYVGKNGAGSMSGNQRKNLDPIKAKSDINIVSTFVGNELSQLLPPEIFAPTPPCSSSGASSTEFCTNTELPLVNTRYAQEEEMQRRLNFSEQGTLNTTCSQIVQMNCNSSAYKNDLTKSDILLTPDKFTSACYNAAANNETRMCSSSCMCRLCVTSALEGDNLTSDYEDDIEQELKDIEQIEEEEEKKEKERQTQNQTALSYDGGRLPPIGVFWDIENCQVPKGLSATHVVQAIRARFFNEHREAEFMCVCDTLKEHSKILEELNDAQVNVMHVGSTVKNAADDKLLQSMRRFADIHGTGATIVLISGDSNFATELYDLRYRKNLRVILVHNAHAQDSLKLCAHETALFSEVTQELPQRTKSKGSNLRRDILVRNLPEGVDENAIRRRLRILSDNCGGKVGRVRANCATVYFQTPELATRAKKRLDGEDVYGSNIYCSFGKNLDKEGSPKVKCAGKFPQHQSARDKESDIPVCVKTEGLQIFPNASQPVMGEVGATSLSWRVKDPLSDSPSLQQPYSAFKSYAKTPSIPVSSEQPYNSQRMWRSSSYKSQNQTAVSGVSGNFSGFSRDYSLHNGENTPDSTASQPLYLDKTPDQFKKGRSQKVHFRTSSPPSFSFSNKIPDSYSLSNAPRMRSPSPLLWSGVSPMKHTWSPTTTTDVHNQVLCGLRELHLGEGTTVETSLGSTPQIPVELQVTNLDQNIDAREMKRILFTVFRDHVMVLHVSVFVQSDGNLAASLRVPSQQDAQYAISQLHRKKIGAKRIIISYVNHNQPSPELKRSKVIALLQEVPGKKLPLFKFRELYEKRFHETIGVSEMYNMRDIVTVSDNNVGRMVSLHPEFRHIQSPVFTESAEEDDGNISRFCKVHSLGPDESVGWAERDQSTSLPNINMTLRALAASIHSLLQSHSGFLPLASLVECYKAEIGPLEEYEDGVSIEHLVSCLPGVCILTATTGFKYIQWLENKVIDEAEELARCVSPPLVGQLALFSRELVDLLKTFPHCRLPFSRFIPAYHHHFGRQCRVADYGFTKLADLFDALPHVIQVLGDGNKRILTLAHKAQIKRFSSDLLRVLKGQPTKSITLEAFPVAYEKALTRPWSIIDYGVCDVEDLLVEVSETTVIVTRSGTETTIAIPKREQTPEEMERTRQFAAEVVELLRHSPQCKMQFNRFIPAYHHHFGRQCRVADYGFSKLIELFEAIPDILQAYDDEEDGEKHLQLVERERVRVLGDQVAVVVRGAPRQAIRLSALTQVFTRYYGYSLKPNHYGSNSLEELMGKLRNHVKMVEAGDEPIVTLVDRGYVHDVMLRSRQLLWDDPSCCYPLDKFVQMYTDRYNHPPSLEIIKRDLEEVLTIEGEGNDAKISLVPLQIFARDLLTLLHEAGGRMLLLNFDTAYLDRYGVACRPAAYGFPNIVALVQALGDLVTVRGRGTKRILVLHRDTASSPPVNNTTPNSTNLYGHNTDRINENGEAKPPPASQLPPLHKITSPPPCNYQHYIQEPNTNGHLVMSVNPPTSHQSYQPSPPVVYPGSPAPTGGSVMWGQMWSPQYPVMPPLSPAHYMVPTIPMSWGSVAASPVGAITSTSPPAPLVGTMAPPVSIHMLDELSKQESKGAEDYTTPPSASELPSPELFTQMSASESAPASAPTCGDTQMVNPPVCGEEEADDTWSSCNSDLSKFDTANTSTPTARKLRTKRRIAAQFTSN
ncbi:meiosis regulator and mRNA stability factor 1-like isoform X2 [Homarus americanus]|uniref:meiosis regulator and mRNA stability factor 1-like isoform X2 n=1 Tax=Homarus americanus TaxID=6706 RepID=UPI001C4763F0|nr:meiosis regulator and mRNA stability factor 1-like isoform X2 [Homarus americanus]